MKKKNTLSGRLLPLLTLLFLILSLTMSLASCTAGDDPFHDGSEDPSYSLETIPEYSGNPYVAINENVPFFTSEEIAVSVLEEYSELDTLGRCGVAYACIGKETMPTDTREEIGQVSPSGWMYDGKSNNKSYEFVSGGYIYNRCHLIGFQLAGENANPKNLITGTRYLNIEGMLVFEDMVADYVKASGNHVLYRVTPIFEESNMIASGVLLEAVSVEDGGEGIQFCVYSFNVQPGVTINYFTGQNVAEGEELPPVNDTPAQTVYDYIINTSSKTVHLSSCKSAGKISEANRQEFSGGTELLLEEFKGYKACGVCLPDLVIPSQTPDDNTPEDENPDSGNTDTSPDGTGGYAFTYILNTSSKKYHLPSCSFAPNSSARLEYNKSLEELKEEYPDYEPCGKCKP